MTFHILSQDLYVLFSMMMSNIVWMFDQVFFLYPLNIW